MTNLKNLAKAISQCRSQGDLRGKGYPAHLRKKISSAVQKYGLGNVAQAIGVHRSVIGRWSLEKTSPEPLRKKSSKKKDRPIVFQELPPKEKGPILTSSTRPSPEGAFLRLTSPDGFTIALGGNPGPEVTAGIIRAFMGGLA